MNQEICDYLSTFGITERKSLTLKLKYVNWNVLLGIFDGDGSLTKDARSFNFRFKIASGSLDFSNQLINFFKREGIKAYLYMIDTHMYNVMVTKNASVYTIYDKMYKDSSYFLLRKYDKFCPLVEKFTRE